MIIENQRDQRWAQVKLGQSNLSIGRYGCTTTCISMLSDYFGCFVDPVELQNHLKYTPDGLILWTTLDLPKMQFARRIRFDDNPGVDYTPNILDALKDPDKAVILEVDHSHWLVALSKVPFANGLYRCADPWFADKCFSSRYNRITGAAFFARK